MFFLQYVDMSTRNLAESMILTKKPPLQLLDKEVGHVSNDHSSNSERDPVIAIRERGLYRAFVTIRDLHPSSKNTQVAFQKPRGAWLALQLQRSAAGIHGRDHGVHPAGVGGREVLNLSGDLKKPSSRPTTPSFDGGGGGEAETLGRSAGFFFWLRGPVKDQNTCS